MASFRYMSLLVLLVVAPPQLRGIEMSEPGEITIFGFQTQSITADVTFEWYGAVLNTVEDEIGAPRLWRRLLLRPLTPDGRPRGLIQLRLLGWNGDGTKLLFNVDGLFLIGFGNRTDHWFALKGNMHLMPGATELSFEDSYPELIGGGGVLTNLGALALGKTPFLEAIGILANYPSDPSANLQLAMRTLVIMVPESLRLIPIRAKLIEFCEAGTVGYLEDRKYADYILNWGKISLFLLCSARDHPLGPMATRALGNIGITTREEALQVVSIILWPKVFNPANLDVSCDDLKLRRQGGGRGQGPP